MCAKALITAIETHWSGWVPGGYSSSKTAQVWTEEKTALSPEIFGIMNSAHLDTADSFYEVVVDRIVQDVVVFAYRNLVVDNRDGTINLTAPRAGTFILRWGETKKLSTPTMDAGTSIAITVNEIR